MSAVQGAQLALWVRVGGRDGGSLEDRVDSSMFCGLAGVSPWPLGKSGHLGRSAIASRSRPWWRPAAHTGHNLWVAARQTHRRERRVSWSSPPTAVLCSGMVRWTIFGRAAWSTSRSRLRAAAISFSRSMNHVQTISASTAWWGSVGSYGCCAVDRSTTASSCSKGKACLSLAAGIPLVMDRT